MKILDRDANIKEIDAKCSNKFSWSWLEMKDNNGDFYSDWARKVNLAGKTLCIWCDDTLSYGSSGKKTLTKHSASAKHID